MPALAVVKQQPHRHDEILGVASTSEPSSEFWVSRMISHFAYCSEKITLKGSFRKEGIFWLTV